MREPNPAANPSSTPPAPTDPLYAVVVVYTTLNRQVTSASPGPAGGEEEHYLTRAFHYLVPDALRDVVQVGQLVWVPFHNRYLQGIIVDLDVRSPVEKNLEIAQIIEREPVLSPLHLQLAHWISESYLAPLHLVVQSMLPPGVTWEVDVLLHPTSAGFPPQANEAQRTLLALLQAKGPLTPVQLERLAPLPNGRAVLKQLVNRGWVTKEARLRPPSIKPKRVPIVRLCPSAEAGAPDLKSNKQRQVYDYLLARRAGGDEWVPLSTVVKDTQVSSAIVGVLIEKGLAERTLRQVWRDPIEGQAFVAVTPPPLTPDQEEVWHTLRADLDHPGGRPFLLHGVTGSGKTEIYLRAVQHVLAQGRGAIVLVPEIALTPQTVRRFGARFPATIAVLHSQLSGGERYDQWRRIRAGELRLVVGARSAIFAPVPNLGLIVLDEEHEWTYKQDQVPRYHAREVAIQLARLAGATCLLGSATPDIESRYRVERGEFVRLALPQRILGHRDLIAEQGAQLQRDAGRYTPLAQGADETLYAELPPVEVVDMRAELRAGNASIFSRALQKGIEAALAAHEQVILFLNRRGNATFVMCRDCGYVVRCPRCNLPLTYHSAIDSLVCHQCNRRCTAPTQCPICFSKRIRFFGTGTQRVEEQLRARYPQARVVRWDADTTGAKAEHERILDRFVQGQADIMVGTQMIAKGLDLPKVTLVGVITADTLINLPDFRSGERTFQLLTQVAGRAGRSILGGRVIIQTYTPQHPAIQAASRHDSEGFYAQEIAFRREHWYPPICRLVHLVYSHSNNDGARQGAEELARLLRDKIARLGLTEIDLIGPAPAFFPRLRGKSRWQLIIRGKDPLALISNMRLPLGWQVDVDPVSLL